MNELEILRKQLKQLKKINEQQEETIKKQMKEISKEKQEAIKRSQWVELYDKDI
jgi:mRNA-degrading endonuclease RelE of RelBE toxin-antitoxin system